MGETIKASQHKRETAYIRYRLVLIDSTESEVDRDSNDMMNLSFTMIFDADGAPELDNGWIIQHHPPPEKWIKKREGKKKLK